MRTAACLALLLSAVPAAAQEFPYAARVAADGLPAHAGPLVDDYVTATLPRGAALTVVRHDPGGRALVRAPAGAISFAKLSWLTMTEGSPEAGGTATVTADGKGEELYCLVGSRVGETPDIEQVSLRPGQSVKVLGVVTLRDGETGKPVRWAKIPSPPGEFRWVSLRYLVPVNADARADRDRDPYAVPADLLGEPSGGHVQTAGFVPDPAEAAGSGVVEMAFAAPRPLPGSDAAVPLLNDAAAAAAAGPADGPVPAAAFDPFGPPTDPLAAAPVLSGTSDPAGAEGGWATEDPTLADRFADRGAAAVAADRRRLEELDLKLDSLLEADPTDWDLEELAADLRDLRDRAGSKSVRRLASARLVRVDVLRTIQGRYGEYVGLTAATDRRDAVLTAEAAETLRRFAQVVPTYGDPLMPRTAAGPMPGVGYDYGGGYPAVGGEYPGLDAPTPPALAAPTGPESPDFGIDRIAHTRAAGAAQPDPRAEPARRVPPGAVAFEAVGVLREVARPPHPQAPRFALVAADGRVAAYLREDPRLGLPNRVGQTLGVNGRRFRHPQIAAPMIAVTRMVPVRQ